MEKINSAFEFDPRQKIIISILGAILMGMIWRIRGSYSFGSLWGMLSVAVICCLFLYVLFGESKKMSWGFLGVMIISMAITVGGWGTIIGQVTGRLSSYGHGAAAAYDVPVNPTMGWVWTFLIGFGWFPLFAFLIAQVFSEREYKFKDYMVIIMIFYAGLLFSELLLSHLVIPIISPDAYILYANSLGEITPWQDYILNFKNADYYKTIPGGRNYAAMVSNFSSSFGALIVWIFLKFKKSDKITAKLYIWIIVFMGISITLANLFQFYGRGCIYDFETQASTCIPPEWIQNEFWPLWEYFTGFLAGFMITILLLNTPLPKNMEKAEFIIPDKYEKTFTIFLTIIVAFGLSWIRPLASRISTHYPGKYYDSIVYIGGSIIILVLVFIFYIKTRNCDFATQSAEKKITYASWLLILFNLAYMVIDLFIRDYNPLLTPRVYIWLIFLGSIISVFLIRILYSWKFN